MGALDKTKHLLRLQDCPLTLLVKNDKNPNKMSAREFDLLVDNMNKLGWTEPVLCHPFGDMALTKLQKLVKANLPATELYAAMAAQSIILKIDGGHHRYDAASFLGFETGPVTVIMDPKFDEEQATFQLVRMNAIHGKLDPAAFIQLYNEMSAKYADDVIQESFGFAEEAEFKKLITQMAKTLPDKATQDKFKEAAAEIKTIDGLAKLLNHMFTTYGDTLPYGYMIFDYGGQRSMWLRVESKTMKALDVVADICVDRRRTVDDIIGRVIQLIAKGDSPELIDALVAETPEVPLAGEAQSAPTKDHLAKMAVI